jgi:hypothetical protein
MRKSSSKKPKIPSNIRDMTDQELAAALKYILGRPMPVTDATRPHMELRYFNLITETAKARRDAEDDDDDTPVRPRKPPTNSVRHRKPAPVPSRRGLPLSDNEGNVAEEEEEEERVAVRKTGEDTSSGVNGKLICIFLLFAIALGIYYALAEVGRKPRVPVALCWGWV